jgi:hypothetical protein
MRTRLRNQRGNALIETAVTLPIILFVSVSIFEFGRAYQVQQVLTNAAREGARVAILGTVSDGDVLARVTKYLDDGKVIDCDSGGNCSPMPTITINRSVEIPSVTGGTAGVGSEVTIVLPYSFMVLNPVANLVTDGSNVGTPITMRAVSLMRNE